jgi:hypothetical protein
MPLHTYYDKWNPKPTNKIFIILDSDEYVENMSTNLSLVKMKKKRATF